MKLFLPFLGLFCLFSLSSSQAQTPLAPPSDTTTLHTLAGDVDRLEQRAERLDRIVSRLPKVSGYAQVGYEASKGSSDFMVKSVRVALSGELGSKLDYMLQLELVNPKLLDAFIRYRALPWLNLQLGEFKLPFTIENTQYTPLNFEFIEYPTVLYRLGGFTDLCGVSASGRDLGFMINGGFFNRGSRHILSYDLGIFNGEGLNIRDKNRSKDIVGRLMLRPIDGLLLAGYCYWGEYGPHYLKRLRYGGGACYDRGAFVVRGEYIGGTTGLISDSVIHNTDSEGWYAMGGIRPIKKLLFAVRYDTFSEDRMTDTRQDNYTAGITWEPVRHLRCQLNYTYEDHAATNVGNRHVVAIALTGSF